MKEVLDEERRVVDARGWDKKKKNINGLKMSLVKGTKMEICGQRKGGGEHA